MNKVEASTPTLVTPQRVNDPQPAMQNGIVARVGNQVIADASVRTNTTPENSLAERSVAVSPNLSAVRDEKLTQERATQVLATQGKNSFWGKARWITGIVLLSIAGGGAAVYLIGPAMPVIGAVFFTFLILFTGTALFIPTRSLGLLLQGSISTTQSVYITWFTPVVAITVGVSIAALAALGIALLMTQPSNRNNTPNPPQEHVISKLI